MKTLMVSPYAPYRDGIAVYVVQEVREMRRSGETVEVLSPLPSAAHHHLDLGGPRGFLRLAKKAEDYDRVIIQLYPELLLGKARNFVERAGSWASLVAVCRSRPTELRIHEIDYGPALKHPIERRAAKAAMTAAEKVTVHTSPEAKRLREVFGVDAEIVDHGSHFTKHASLTQSEARAELGLPESEHIFLAIGFLQDHKGFDRAIAAFADSEIAGASLHIVGSVRVELPELLEYAAKLQRMAAAVPNVYVHQRFVGDDEFDRWIVASDTVVLPYREIWSSSVLERAKIYGVPVIASRVGGLADQLSEGSELFEDEDGLESAMRRRAGTAGASAERDSGEGPLDRHQIEAQVRRSLGVDPSIRAGSKVFRRSEPLAMAASGSRRPGIGQIKRLVQAATAWQIRPLVERINSLEASVAEAFDRLERDEN